MGGRLRQAHARRERLTVGQPALFLAQPRQGGAGQGVERPPTGPAAIAAQPARVAPALRRRRGAVRATRGGGERILEQPGRLRLARRQRQGPPERRPLRPAEPLDQPQQYLEIRLAHRSPHPRHSTISLRSNSKREKSLRSRHAPRARAWALDRRRVISDLQPRSASAAPLSPIAVDLSLYAAILCRPRIVCGRRIARSADARGTQVRLASYNVENLFDRAKALNLDSWAEGRPILEAYAELDELLGEIVYTDGGQASHGRAHDPAGSRAADTGPFVLLRRNRGGLLKRPRTGGIEIAAEGRADWVGSLELRDEPIDEHAMRNTARVMIDIQADVLGVVEAESRPVLANFNAEIVPAMGGTPFRHVMVIDGNDDRGIDVGLMTRDGFPIGVDAQPCRRPASQRQAGLLPRLPGVHGHDAIGPALVVMVNHFKSKGYGGTDASNAKRRRRPAGQRRSTRIARRRRGAGRGPRRPQRHARAATRCNRCSAHGDLSDAFTHPAFDDGGYPGTYGLLQREQQDRLPAAVAGAASRVAGRRRVPHRHVARHSAAAVGNLRRADPATGSRFRSRRHLGRSRRQIGPSERIARDLQIAPPVALRGGIRPARMFTCTDGRISLGMPSVRSRAVRIATNSSSETPSWTWALSRRSTPTVISQRNGSRSAAL